MQPSKKPYANNELNSIDSIGPIDLNWLNFEKTGNGDEQPPPPTTSTSTRASNNIETNKIKTKKEKWGQTGPLLGQFKSIESIGSIESIELNSTLKEKKKTKTN